MKHTWVANTALMGFLFTSSLAASWASGVSDNWTARWNAAVLSGIKDEKPSPPMAARILAVVHTCIYDAWSMTDTVAVGVHSNTHGEARFPPQQRRHLDKILAVSASAHTCASRLMPKGKASFDRLLAEAQTLRGTEPLAAETAGISAAQAVLRDRERDGSNQNGDLSCNPASDTKAYCDYTGYVPVNTGSKPIAEVDPNRWQPLPNGQTHQLPLSPHWGHVKPFAAAHADEFLKAFKIPRQRLPKKHGTQAYARQVEAAILESRLLAWQKSGEKKAIVEYWADGPFSYLPPGHFGDLAHHVVRRDNLDTDQTVKLFFVLHNASFDAGIAIWHLKYLYDYVRPITAVRHVKNGQRLLSWGGPETAWDNSTDPSTGRALGYNRWINGEDWLPYNPTNNPNHPLTPAFPEYPSGHSGFSAASAQALKMFTGSSDFAYVAEYDPYAPAWIPTLVEAPHLIGKHRWLYPSYVSAANQAGWSRRYGGIHFEDGDLVARQLGKQIGHRAWEKSMYYFNGGDNNVKCRRLKRCVAKDHIPDGNPRWITLKD